MTPYQTAPIPYLPPSYSGVSVSVTRDWVDEAKLSSPLRDPRLGGRNCFFIATKLEKNAENTLTENLYTLIRFF